MRIVVVIVVVVIDHAMSVEARVMFRVRARVIEQTMSVGAPMRMRGSSMSRVMALGSKAVDECGSSDAHEDDSKPNNRQITPVMRIMVQS